MSAWGTEGGWRRAAALLSCAAMKHWDRRIVILGRLKAKPLVAWQLLCGLVLAGLVARQWRGAGAAEIAANLLLGNPIATAAMAAAAFGVLHFHRLWRQRESYIFHDGARLHRGSDGSWPLASIRDAVIERSEIGVASLRLVVDDDSETTRELVKLYLLADAPEAVRGAVLFAVAGARGVPAGAAVH